MGKKINAIFLLFFIMTLTAGLISVPGSPACAQTPEETDEDEIIDCINNPEYCEEEEPDDLIYGYVLPALPPVKESEPTLMMPEGGFLSFLVQLEDFPEFCRSDQEPWAEDIHVKNQRPAGTCWAFSMTTAAEYSYAKQSYDSLGPVAELSHGHLVYFRYNRVDDPLHNTTGDQYIVENNKKNWPDAGGSQIDAALHLSTWSGFDSEKEAPYQNVRDGFSSDDKGKQHWDPDHKSYDDAIAYSDSLVLRSFQYVRWMFPAELNFLPDSMTKEEYRDNRIRLIKRLHLDHRAVNV